MKKFEFTLEKLKSYKDQLLEREKLKLAAMRKQLLDMKERLSALQKEYIQCNEELNEKTKMGTTPQDIWLAKGYINELNERIKQQHKAVADMEAKVHTQVQVVVTSTQDVTTLEKLKDKQYEEYRYLEGKEQEIIIEEFVSNSTSS